MVKRPPVSKIGTKQRQQRLFYMTIQANDPFGRQHRIQYRFLSRFGGGPEKKVYLPLIQLINRMDVRSIVDRKAVSGREADGHLAASVPDIGAKADQPDRAALEHAPELTVAQRNVGREDHHAGAFIRGGGIQLFTQLGTDIFRRREGKVRQTAVVGLNKDAKGILLPVQRERSGGTPDPALERMAGGSPPRSDRAEGEIFRGAFDRRKDVRLFDRAVGQSV